MDIAIDRKGTRGACDSSNLSECRDLLQARKYFEQAIENEDARESSYSALGIIECLEEKLDSAVEWFHKVSCFFFLFTPSDEFITIGARY